MNAVTEKQNRLKEHLQSLDSVAVAFSGGVDSSFLLKSAQDALGDRVIAVTGSSLSFPRRELDAARGFASAHGIRHFVVESEELAVDGFADNPPNRCYLCKKGLFAKITALAESMNAGQTVEASNLDDEGDYRPGLQALAELGIVSPLREARLTKADIRALSKAMGLATWDKPSFACLASRFPYGERINAGHLRRVDAAEQFLLDLGMRQVRVRFHDQGRLARIEADEKGFALMSDSEIRQRMCARFQELGFVYIALDLQGYRTGSMNKTLAGEHRSE